MVTDDLMKNLRRERPDGVSFDPMALRLLRQVVPFEDWQIEELKNEMFQLEDERWFCLDMIADDDIRLTIQKQATDWLEEYHCFSVDRLFENYYGGLRHVSTPEYFAFFLQHLGLAVAEYGNGGFYTFRSTSILRDSLISIAKSIAKWQEEADGILALDEIEGRLPYLTGEALEDIRTKFLPEIHIEEVGGVSCWRNLEAVHLPEDFADKLTDAVDTLLFLGKKVDTGHLEFALDLFYRTPFRETYNLMNRRVFVSTCAKHYKNTPTNKDDFSREFFRDWTKHYESILINSVQEDSIDV